MFEPTRDGTHERRAPRCLRRRTVNNNADTAAVDKQVRGVTIVRSQTQLSEGARAGAVPPPASAGATQRVAPLQGFKSGLEHVKFFGIYVCNSIRNL